MYPTYASIQLCQSGQSGWLFTIDYGMGKAQFYKTDDKGEGLWLLFEGQWCQIQDVVNFQLPRDYQQARIRIYVTLDEDHIRWVRIRMNKTSFFQTLDLMKNGVSQNPLPELFGNVLQNAGKENLNDQKTGGLFFIASRIISTICSNSRVFGLSGSMDLSISSDSSAKCSSLPVAGYRSAGRWYRPVSDPSGKLASFEHPPFLEFSLPLYRGQLIFQMLRIYLISSSRCSKIRNY